jgi:hypothetical protein
LSFGLPVFRVRFPVGGLRIPKLFYHDYRVIERAKWFSEEIKSSTIGNVKSFFWYDTCSKNQIPPNPPFPKGGTYGISFESPPLKKGDLGGFKSRQSEEFFGKRYKVELLNASLPWLAKIGPKG